MNRVPSAGNTFHKTERLEQQARRRLSELEIASRLGCETERAWHVNQAVRSGASLSEIQEAVEHGMERRGAPATLLTPCTDEWLRAAGGGGNLRPARRAGAVPPALRCSRRPGRYS